MSAIRRSALIVGLLVAVLLTAVFAYSNPARVPIDFGIVRLEAVPVPLAFAVCLAIGWVLGLASAGTAVLRISRERRRLRRQLRLAEAEVSSLRSLPLHDAD
ncbi:MAG TPA: lipopolysaccharide assembly protein LapA domain-containing protein [Gammaproteobacteria bacterium]|nr:lipopolysaccharide assembly protein LapA domain-containing protein [Gammaproteobacteria bacterium]